MPIKESEFGQSELRNDVSSPEELSDGAIFTADSPHSAEISKQNLFKDIPYHLLEPILAECSVQHLKKGEVLLVPGQENHHLFLLVYGRLQVHLDTADSQVSFPIARGECIGEMSIIESRLTSAYVVAEEASSLVVVPESLFWGKFIHLPGAVKNLLQVLAHRMRKVNDVVLQALEQELRYEQLQKELEAAGKIQANILPREIPLFPHHPQVDVCATLEPAREVGGDFFDAFALNNQHIYIAIGDVCGKGMPAALFMVRVMTLLRTSLSRGDVFASILPAVNQMLCENNEDSMFVSLFVGLFDVTSGVLTYMNGGHNPPFFSSNGNAFNLLEVPRGMVLGVFEDAPYHVAKLTFQPGDTLVLYTDGVTEAENSQQEFFSTDRATEVLSTVAEDDITTVLKTLQDAVFQFSKGRPQSDDITMLALRYRGALT